MKRFLLLISALFLLVLPACANGTNDSGEKTESKIQLSGMKIKIDVTSDTGSHTLNATLADNSSAKAFYAELEKSPITVQMHDYGSFEKVGSLPKSLTRNDTQITTQAGDIILYQGNQITIYYDENSWNFTRLGKVEGKSQAELKQILGQGNVTAVFEIKSLEY